MLLRKAPALEDYQEGYAGDMFLSCLNQKYFERIHLLTSSSGKASSTSSLVTPRESREGGEMLNIVNSHRQAREQKKVEATIYINPSPIYVHTHLGPTPLHDRIILSDNISKAKNQKNTHPFQVRILIACSTIRSSVLTWAVPEGHNNEWSGPHIP